MIDMKKALISPMQGDLVVQIEPSENIFPVAEPLLWVDCPDEVETGYTYKDGVFEPPFVPQPDPEDLAQTYIDYIQRRLDTFAQTRGYDSALSCCTYVASTVAKFRAEGHYMVEARDLTWSTGYQILADVQAGLRPIPTFEELDAEMPDLQWPNVT